jgi:hydroxypyruvate reductase
MPYSILIFLPSTMIREDAISIFKAAVAAVQPSTLMQQHVQRENEILRICHQSFSLPENRPVWVFGAGKAVAAMAQSLEEILTGIPVRGMVITKYDHALPLRHITVAEAGHPLPDENGVRATQQMMQQLQEVQANDIVLFLLSGGASALLADYPAGTSLPEVQQVFELLLKSGADIHEMNTVRKHLSVVKGGQLALMAGSNAWCSLILSDVVGDDLSIIGSGPTIADPSTFADAVTILDRYHLTEKLPAAIHQYLMKGCAGEIPETPKPGTPALQSICNFLIGSNSIALEAAKQTALSLGYYTHILTTTATGPAHILAAELVTRAMQWQGERPACLLMGGESTVIVQGKGLGGRNQQLALAAGIKLSGRMDLTLLSAGTDGTDGPTDAAGAITDAQIMHTAETQGLDALEYLEQNDAYHFFEKVGGLIKTGATQTNVMDIMLVIISGE